MTIALITKLYMKLTQWNSWREAGRQMKAVMDPCELLRQVQRQLIMTRLTIA